MKFSISYHIDYNFCRWLDEGQDDGKIERQLFAQGITATYFSCL